MRAYATTSRVRWSARKEAGHETASRWHIVALGAILMVSALTHFLNLEHFPHLLHDEGVYAGRALMYRETGQLYEPGRGFFGHPFMGWLFLSFFFTVLRFPGSVALGVGDNALALDHFYFLLRATAAFVAVVCTLLVYLIASRAFRSRKYGLFAAALFGVAPASVWYFRLVILDVFMAMWVLLAIYLALVAKDTRRPLVAALSGAAFGLACLTKVPAISFFPVFGAIFVQVLLNNRGLAKTAEGRGNGLRLALAWSIPAVAVASLWVAYAISSGDLGKLTRGLEWHAGMGGGYSFPGLMRYLFGLDPVLFVLGALGIVLSAARRDLFGVTLGSVYFIFLALIKVHWDFYIAPLVPVLAVLGGRFMVDALLFATSLMQRRRPGEVPLGRPRLVGISMAATLITLLLVPLPFTASMISQDPNWAPIRASDYIIREAPPYSLVVANTPYELAIGRTRADLWTLNWWDGAFDVLGSATHNATLRQQAVQIRQVSTGRIVFEGPVVGQTVQVHLPPGDYVAEARKYDSRAGQILSAGRVPIHLDRNLGLIFLAYYLNPQVLVDRDPGSQGGMFIVTLLDPVAMSKLLLVDDQAWVDAEKIPFLKEILGSTAPTLYAANSEQSIHQMSLPAGAYVVRVWAPGKVFVGSVLVKLDIDQAIVFNVDSPASSTQSLEVKGPLDPARQHTLRIIVQHINGLPLSWAWVEVQHVNARAYYQNGVNSAEVRVAEGG